MIIHDRRGAARLTKFGLTACDDLDLAAEAALFTHFLAFSARFLTMRVGNDWALIARKHSFARASKISVRTEWTPSSK